MNRTDRLLAIVLELQGKGKARAEDLAEIFETSKRTIYRDIQALGEAGVPLLSTPGRGYSLIPGYFLPPLSFTADEAIMLLLGSDFLAQNFDAQYRQAARSAERKIAGVLPEKLREEVSEFQQNIRLIGPHPETELMDLLQQLRRAILQRNTIRFRYFARHKDAEDREANQREADPYELIYIQNTWHLIAYCHLRQDIRHFRLERIEALELLHRSFKRRPDLNQPQSTRNAERQITVRVLCDHQITRWVREAPFFFIVNMEETPDGLLVTLTIRQEREILQWLLGWGSHIQVLEPESLKQLLCTEAQTIVQKYT